MILSRRRVLISLCAFLLLALSVVMSLVELDRRLSDAALSDAVSRQPSVLLDAGHGGPDGGAVSNGIREADVNLAVTLRLRDFLTLMGFRVTLTRDGDYSVHSSNASTLREMKHSDLMNRLAMMKSPDGEISVSIHQNIYEEAYVHGAQVFYGAAESSRELAELIQKNVAQVIQKDNRRRIKEADSTLFILKNNTVNPSVMVECGFLSNPAEAQNLKDPAYQSALAVVIGASVVTFAGTGSY